MLPLGFAGAFYAKGQDLSSCVMLWWAGQNFIPISAYIKDSRTLALPFVGGEIHDWAFILGKVGLLGYDQWIGNFVWLMGVLIMVGASVLGIRIAMVFKKVTSND